MPALDTHLKIRMPLALHNYKMLFTLLFQLYHQLQKKCLPWLNAPPPANMLVTGKPKHAFVQEDTR